MTQARSSDPKTPALEPFRTRWDQASAFEPAHGHVLKVALLRALSRYFHSERSVLKARPLAESTEQTLATLEARVDRFSQQGDLSGLTFEELLQAPLPPPQAEPSLEGAPARLRSGLERPDRRWERRLFRAALAARWIPYLMECELPLTEIGAFHTRLETDFDDTGVCLWVDAASVPAPAGKWSGHWWWMLRPGAKPAGLGRPARWVPIEDAP